MKPAGAFPLFNKMVVALILFVCPLNTRADITVNAGRGPVVVNVPPVYDPGVPLPLIVFLHGYTSSGPQVEGYVRLTGLSDTMGFFYMYPNGTENSDGNRFWNATNACCNFLRSTVDDVQYLAALVDSTKLALSVDSTRVYFSGHSNGGFMSHRMACERPELIAGIASFAGATWNDPGRCGATGPVAVLQIHGTADSVIRFGGGSIGSNSYPGAATSVAQWAATNGCREDPVVGDSLDLVTNLSGTETAVTRYPDCEPGGAAELWAMQGGSHVPAIGPNFSQRVVEWLLNYAKPGAIGKPSTATAATSWGALKRDRSALLPKR